MKRSRPFSHATIKHGTSYWVVGGGWMLGGSRVIQGEREVEVRNFHSGKCYFWLRVRPASWRNKKSRKRPRRMLCATNDVHRVVPLSPMELLARVPLEPE
jgi:hypothetical protein